MSRDVLQMIPVFTRPLSMKQERFIDEYMKSCNATQAAIRAGYSERTAHQIGYQLLRNSNIAVRVEQLRAELRMGTNLTVERVRKELARLAFSNPKALVDPVTGKLRNLHDLSDDDSAAIASIENEEIFEGRGEDREHVGTLRKVKLWDKGRALELAAKHLGMVREQPAFAIGSLTIVIED